MKRTEQYRQREAHKVFCDDIQHGADAEDEGRLLTNAMAQILEADHDKKKSTKSMEDSPSVVGTARSAIGSV
jgi:hypothetical protein